MGTRQKLLCSQNMPNNNNSNKRIRFHYLKYKVQSVFLFPATRAHTHTHTTCGNAKFRTDNVYEPKKNNNRNCRFEFWFWNSWCFGMYDNTVEIKNIDEAIRQFFIPHLRSHEYIHSPSYKSTCSFSDSSSLLCYYR